jgi:hypothetical protein
MSKMIADEGLDIVAFQEVYGEYEIDGIRRNLPPCWKGEYVYGSEFSFIWNSYRVEECSTDLLPWWKRVISSWAPFRVEEYSTDPLPHIFASYKADKHMMREPLYGRFSPKHLDTSNEFRLIDIHIVHGGDDTSISIARRKVECSLAKGEIYRTIDAYRYGNFKRAFTVVLGDYNLDCDECNLSNPGDVQTFQAEKTTLKRAEPDYHNSYDHFSYDVVKNSSVPHTVSRIDAVNRYFGGDFTSYRQNVSDHVPVKIEIF